MYWDSDTYLLYNSFDKHYLKITTFTIRCVSLLMPIECQVFFHRAKAKALCEINCAIEEINIAFNWEP